MLYKGFLSFWDHNLIWQDVISAKRSIPTEAIDISTVIKIIVL